MLARTPGNIVKNDGNFYAVGNGLEVKIQTAVGRLIIVKMCIRDRPSVQ